MSTHIGIHESQHEPEWRAWSSAGRDRDRRGSAFRMTILQWVTIAALFLAVARWPIVSPYQEILRFTVLIGALAVTFRAFSQKNYVLATVFGALAVLFNPISPFFDFSGNWQRALTVASAFPFLASVSLRKTRKLRYV